MKIINENSRIIVRSWETSDLDDFFEIYGDPDLFRYIPGGKHSASKEEAKERLEKYIHFNQPAFEAAGLFAIYFKELKKCVGTVLLKLIPLSGGGLSQDVEIGWHTNKICRGRGITTEAARLVIDYARRKEIKEIRALLDPENIASARVAEKCGMREIGMTDRYYDEECKQFILHLDQ